MVPFPDPALRAVTERIVPACRHHFGVRLRAVYVWGSVTRGQAVDGCSDADAIAFLSDTGGEADHLPWRHDLPALDLKQFVLTRVPGPSTVTGVDGVAGSRERFLLFLCRRDGIRLWRRNVFRDLPVPPADRSMAREGVAAVALVVRRGAAELPHEASLLLRKLARFFVLAGAFMLMARGQFQSFRGADVLPALQRALPRWSAFFAETERRYLHPCEAADEDVNAYRARLRAFVEHVQARIELPDAKF